MGSGVREGEGGCEEGGGGGAWAGTERMRGRDEGHGTSSDWHMVWGQESDWR